MKRKGLFILCFFCFLGCSIAQKNFAHSVDETHFYLTIPAPSPTQSEYKYSISYYMSWSQTLHVLEETLPPNTLEELKPGSSLTEYLTQTFTQHETSLQKSIISHMTLTNNNSPCQIRYDSFRPITETAIFSGKGIEFTLSLSCTEVLDTLHFTNLIFFDDEGLQKNILHILDEQGNLLITKESTKEQQEIIVSLGTLPIQPHKDQNAIPSPPPQSFWERIVQLFTLVFTH